MIFFDQMLLVLHSRYDSFVVSLFCLSISPHFQKKKKCQLTIYFYYVVSAQKNIYLVIVLNNNNDNYYCGGLTNALNINL